MTLQSEITLLAIIASLRETLEDLTRKIELGEALTQEDARLARAVVRESEEA